MAVISLVFSGTESCASVRSRVGGVGRQRVQGLQPLALVMGAARRLAVDGDEVVTLRPQRGCPAFKTPRKQGRIDAVEDGANPARAGNAEVKRAEPPQKIQMIRTPQDDVVEIVAGGDGGEGHQQQHLMQGIHQTGPGKLILHRTKIENLHDGAPRIQSAPEYTSPSSQNPTEHSVNLISEP